MQPVSGWASKLYIDPCEGEIMWFFFVSSSLCHPAVLLLMLLILGGLLFTLFIAPPLLVTPRLHTLMSSSEHNLCLPVSSWESPTSKRGIWIIKLLFLAFPLRVTDLTSWSSPTPALLPSLFHSCSLMWTLSSFSPSLSSVHLFCSLQIADLYKKQQQVQNQGEKADPEDYYWLSSAENNK